ncbi:MAG: hypothetical protein QOJ32_2135 [Frankiaceae bacterium]|jgi:hypothetical protein|nr:hypothetical protein [Frankiaceae bacterium]MDQ1635326.1 hypothetical protein [Frankiaceae bacterium]
MNRTPTDPTVDLLAVPWAATMLPIPREFEVRFSTVAASGPGRTTAVQRLVRPWDGVQMDAPVPSTVSFASLTGPNPSVVPSQRPNSPSFADR